MNKLRNLVDRSFVLTEVARLLLGIFLILIASTAGAQPAARMGISPDRYQITFDERGGETQSLLVQNVSNEPLTVSLSVNNWELDDNNQIVIVPPTEHSLDQWIAINPLRITIPPGTPQTFRWAIMPRQRPQPGEYRAIIFIEEVLPPHNQEEGMMARVKMRFGLPIYAQVGEHIQSAELHGINVEDGSSRLGLDLSNTGNSHGRMSGNYGIWPIADYPGRDRALSLLRTALNRPAAATEFTVGSMPGSVILPGNRRVIPIDLVLDNAIDYVVQLNAEFAGLEIRDSINISKPGT